MNRRRGFTLIELLIVVAIIAILAAIAVPNFLEAQTRAKVSRVKADMRTCATAIESYTVDWNEEPIGYLEYQRWLEQTYPPAPIPASQWYNGLGTQNGQIHIWSRMTTPIAYISSPPVDPFVEKGAVNTGETLIFGTYKYYRYEYISDIFRGPYKVSSGGDYVKAYALGARWMLQSFGPWRHWRWGQGMKYGLAIGYVAKLPSTAGGIKYPDALYDPTNGTMSGGFIIRSNMGQY
jgi:prepilin-type N-terminal cleavage/methylation domain-containing protein